MLNVFSTKIHKGEKLFFTINGPDFANKAVVQMPVIALSGKHPGPTFWINGAVHGDELNGSVAAWELIKEIDPNDVKGNIVVTPVANLAAFMDSSTISRVDDTNMDTQFPGDPCGTFSQRLAKMLYDEIKKTASFLLSFHTMNKTHDALTYTVSKIIPGADKTINEHARNMAIAFGAKSNCVVDLATATGELPGATVGALDIVCIKDGIPAFMAEMGHGCIADPTYIAEGIRGIKNVMIFNGMLEGDIKKEPNQNRITNRKFLRAPNGGMFDACVKPGDVVNAGCPFGSIHYFGENITPILLEQDSYVIGLRKFPAVNTGDRIGFIGLEWENI